MTPRTPKQGQLRSETSKTKKLENFTQTLFEDKMVIENWVTTNQDGISKTKNKNLPSLWHQFNKKGQLRNESVYKPDHSNLDFFRDLGPLARIMSGRPEAQSRFFTANQKLLTN